MSLPLDFHPNVRDEIAAAHDWYEARRPGLGSDFLDEMQRVLGEIAANPDRYGFINGEIRVGLLKRFPYAIYFRGSVDWIRVLAIYHTARSPSGWQSRE